MLCNVNTIILIKWDIGNRVLENQELVKPQKPWIETSKKYNQRKRPITINRMNLLALYPFKTMDTRNHEKRLFDTYIIFSLKTSSSPSWGWEGKVRELLKVRVRGWDWSLFNLEDY